MSTSLPQKVAKPPLKLVSNRQVILPPQHQEPEKSFYPDPKESDTLERLNRFIPHMGQILSANENTRNYREYALTFALSGAKTDFNMRMRCHVNLLENGELFFSNWQLTFKTKGNHQSRTEIETNDNLASSDLKQALIALKMKYGTDLLAQIAQINPSDLYVDTVAINSRTGLDKTFSRTVSIIPEFEATVMHNSDNVLFIAPQICDEHGNLLLLGANGTIIDAENWKDAWRPEAELEVKNISGNFAIITKPLKSENADKLKSHWFGMALTPLSAHAQKLFPKTIFHTKSKVDEAQHRSRLYTGPRTRMTPSNYDTPHMKEALTKLMNIVPSPYGNDHEHTATVKSRTQLISKARAQGQTAIPMQGYTIYLPN